MGKAHTGLHFLHKGEKWRKKYLAGTSIDKIAFEEQQNRQVVSRCIWLAKIPEDLKKIICDHPDVFSRKILVDTFAAKRRQCEQNCFKLMYTEIRRMIGEGAGSKPLLKKTARKKKNLSPMKKEKLEQESLVFYSDKSLEASLRIKQALSMQANVVFEKNGDGEIRIFFKNEKELEFVLGRIEELEQISSVDLKNRAQPFLGFID